MSTITEYFEKEFIASRPRSVLTGVEWAEKYRVLTTVSSSLPGPFRASVFKVATGILNAVTSGKAVSVAWACATQNAKTETILNAIGYFIDQKPQPIMLVYPEKADCKDMSKIRIQDMIDNAKDEVLKKRIDDTAVRQEIYTIPFIGGYLYLAWASSVNRLASKPIGIIFMDEVDKFQAISSHGSPLSLVQERQKAFIRSLTFMVSSPTFEFGAIWQQIHSAEYLFRYRVPCLLCGFMIDFNFDHVKADDSGVSYICPHCGGVHTDIDKPMMIDKGYWVTDKNELLDDVISTGNKLNIGFHSSSFHSPFISFSKIYKKYLDSINDPEKHQVFVNGWLGKPFDNSIYELDHSADKFINRIESLDPLPLDCLMLVASVDVQKDRLETQVTGFGIDRETFIVDKRVFLGDTKNPLIWAELSQFILNKKYKHIVGREMPILATAVDTGYNTTEAYEFCKSHEAHRVYAVKGKASETLADISAPHKVGRQQVYLYTLNVSSFKDTIYHFLNINDPGAGYTHFNQAVCDFDYFEQLTAEKKELQLIRGKQVSKWVKIRPRNEALDLLVYSHAAYHILAADMSVFQDVILSDYRKLLEKGGVDGR